MANYQPLNYVPLDDEVTFLRPPQILPDNVTADSPATDVMTDFTKVAAITMGPCATLEAAEKRMIATGVRMLLVVDQANHILGVVTLTDLQGERPMLYLQERGGGNRDEIFLRDIMTEQNKLQALEMKRVTMARVGDIIDTMKLAYRQHAIVVETDEEGKQQVRGIFSTKQISAQLGLDYRAKDPMAIFAELEAFLN
ncbi:CBS domain-containing protein [Ectothiorhodospiraceae bacterium BW-2]|nr:CBS domain-containing protein [Ectothiorhodospiraceae bacterium BW-2]